MQGTVGILQSALKNGFVSRYLHSPVSAYGVGLLYRSSIKRIVVTGSTASILQVLKEPKVFSEEDWNEQAIKEVEDEGRNASNMNKYRASKTLAERGLFTFVAMVNDMIHPTPIAAWDFYNKHKKDLTWDLTVMNPPFVSPSPMD